MNPLMKRPLQELSTETQNCFKLLQGELNQQANLFETFEHKLKTLRELGKKTGAQAKQIETELT